MQTDFAISSPKSEGRKASTRRAEGNFSPVPFIGCAEWMRRRTDGAIFSGVARMALRRRERGDSAAVAGGSVALFLKAKSMTRVIRSSRPFCPLDIKVLENSDKNGRRPRWRIGRGS